MFNWLSTNFTQFEGDNYTFYSDENGFIVSDINFVAEQLNGCSTPPTYTEVSALAIALQGWQRIFDQWKEKGLIQ
jgi:hypothetical protein